MADYDKFQNERLNGTNGHEKENVALTEQGHVDPELDRRLNRKFDLRIVPWLFGLWLLVRDE